MLFYLLLSMSSPTILPLSSNSPSLPYSFSFLYTLLGFCYAYDTPNRIVYVLFFFLFSFSLSIFITSFFPRAGILRKVHLQVQIEMCSALRMSRHAFLLDWPVQHLFVLLIRLPASPVRIFLLDAGSFCGSASEFSQSHHRLSSVFSCCCFSDDRRRGAMPRLDDHRSLAIEHSFM